MEIIENVKGKARRKPTAFITCLIVLCIILGSLLFYIATLDLQDGITSKEIFHEQKSGYSYIVEVKNNSLRSNYISVHIETTMPEHEEEVFFEEHLDDDWLLLGDGTFITKEPLKRGETSDPVLRNVFMDKEFLSAESGDAFFLVESYAVKSRGFDNAKQAFKNGEVSPVSSSLVH